MSMILIVVPARGGSKGIHRKNLLKVHDKSLTFWAIKSALKIKARNTLIVVSSDDEEILSESDSFPGVLKLKRPEELSSDFVPDFRVLRHAVDELEVDKNQDFAGVVMLQPTSPLRDPITLQKCVDAIIFDQASSAWTVSKSPSKFHPRKQLKIQDGILSHYLESPLVVARQELQQTYIRNGACYAMSRSTVLEDEKLLGSSARAIECAWPTFNIDLLEEFMELERQTCIIDGYLVPIDANLLQ
jgi:CMP-N-acetylneuraminic acid synthetase